MVNKIRTQRIAVQIREDLTDLLLNNVTDPRVEGAYVTDVTVDRELAYAKVFVSAIEGSTRQEEILDGLRNAAGYLRYQLSQRIQLRSFPQLRFKWDNTPERADRIEELFAQITQETDPDSEEPPKEG
jgi:ribosome-binding factor A